MGYFEFSTDEEVRLRQQEALRKLRRDTEEQQEASVGLRARRQQQLQARLAAARRRKRERLGLPPDSPEPPRKLSAAHIIYRVKWATIDMFKGILPSSSQLKVQIQIFENWLPFQILQPT